MKTDMSPEAVTARLKLASQLRRLCLSLGRAKRENGKASEEETLNRSIQLKEFSMKQEELRQRADEDDKLYERFGRHLESNHSGAFVAIALDGRTIIDSDQIHALEQAISAFGSGNFAFRKIGSRALGRWRTRFGH